MRDMNFRLRFKHKGTGQVVTVIADLESLIDGCEEDKQFGFDLISKDAGTGLKDQSGKEIYEGDNLLISITNYSTGKVVVQKTVPVEFKHCKFGVQWGPSDFTGLDGFSNTTFEIVGHIYEGGQA